jgi:uncharacterized membrane protein
VTRPVFRDTSRGAAWLAVALAAGIVVYVEGQNRLVGCLATALILLAPSAFRARRRERLQFAAALAWLAVFVSFLCEWVCYDDAFTEENERINTIFKVYYALWPVAGIAGVASCSAFWGGGNSSRKRLRRAVALLLMLVLVSVSALYPLFGWTSRIAGYGMLEIAQDELTLDGLSYIESHPRWRDDYKAGLWLRENASPYAIVAEVSNAGYSAAGRFAAIGGVTSLLGWQQHESVWREGSRWDPRPRAAALEELYTTTSLRATLRAIVTYELDYVAVGSLEREGHSTLVESKFDYLGVPVFQSGETTIYAFPRPEVPEDISAEDEP